jgi:group II intron reverse transcriptase/maturase
MKELHKKDLASHLDPESCEEVRKGLREVLTGENAGEPLSREIRTPEMPTLLSEAEGNTSERGKASVKGIRRGRRPSACMDSLWTGTERSRNSSADDVPLERGAKVNDRTAPMYDCGKSDEAVVAGKRTNNPDLTQADLWGNGAEFVEPRASTKRNASQQNIPRTQSRVHGMSHELERVRQRARIDKKTRFTALLHHLSKERLRQSFAGLKKQAAAGVDGVVWKEYAEHLESNLKGLHQRVQRGTYRAKPSRRVYIPKADGKERPLGVAALEDKIVQGAVAEVLNAIYETDFLGFSYGFRPGRGQHDALDALAVTLTRGKVNWVLDADIRGFFDAISHEWLRKFLQHRIGDRRILRLIDKWLQAGVLENGQWKPTEKGTPQGATLSPLLANIYLHYVLDLWLHQWRRKYANGEVIVVRFADDFLVGFQHKEDAERMLTLIRERMAQFALELHSEKTRLIEFGRFAAKKRSRRNRRRPETFDFLGFTHICGENRKGGFILMRHSVSKRVQQKLRAVRVELRKRMHRPIAEQGRWLGHVFRGFSQYHAVPTNGRAVNSFRGELARSWYRSLRRRSEKRRINWKKMDRLVKHWIPATRICHPWPNERFDAKHSR